VVIQAKPTRSVCSTNREGAGKGKRGGSNYIRDSITAVRTAYSLYVCRYQPPFVVRNIALSGTCMHFMTSNFSSCKKTKKRDRESNRE